MLHFMVPRMPQIVYVSKFIQWFMRVGVGVTFFAFVSSLYDLVGRVNVNVVVARGKLDFKEHSVEMSEIKG